MHSLVLCAWLLLNAAAQAPEDIEEDTTPAAWTLVVRESAAELPAPCRVVLRDWQNKPVQPEGYSYFDGAFTCDTPATLTLLPGTYRYTIERGPEFERAQGAFTLDPGGAEETAVLLPRIADMSAEGWWPGDLHIHRGYAELPLLMRAEDLHVGPAITWWNENTIWEDVPIPDELVVQFDDNRYYYVLAGEDERDGGAFMYYNLEAPIDITGAQRHYPSPVRYLREGRDRGAWLDLEKPFWWDAPVAVALGLVDTIGIANNHIQHGGMLDNEAWGKPRPREDFPPPHGNALWSQHLYYQFLNAGFHLPPSAGSASGVLPNPVGYNRVYVHQGDELTWDGWWEGLHEGRSFVTNGPLLRVRADGELSGHTFTLESGQRLELPLRIAVDSRDPIARIEIIRNGEVVETIPGEGRKQLEEEAALRFERNGWFLIRVVADVEETFRFASTAPWYVDSNEEGAYISREAVQFMLDWLDAREEQFELEAGRERREALAPLREAQDVLKERLQNANAP